MRKQTTLTIVELEASIGYIHTRVASGTDKNGDKKFIDLFYHPVMNERYWQVEDGQNDATKHELLSDAVVAFNRL